MIKEEIRKVIIHTYNNSNTYIKMYYFTLEIMEKKLGRAIRIYDINKSNELNVNLAYVMDIHMYVCTLYTVVE